LASCGREGRDITGEVDTFAHVPSARYDVKNHEAESRLYTNAFA